MKASDVVRSFILRKISKNLRIISKLADDSTRVSTICFPIGPFTTFPSNMDSIIIIMSFCSFMNSRKSSSCSGSFESLSCMCANRKRKPLTASHKRECASASWLPVHGP